MKNQEQLVKSRVVKIDSEESWNIYLTQASSQGCPVVVHFTASWCVPSLAMNPFFEEVALNYHDIMFMLVDVDDLKGIASKMEVKAMPTFVLMRQGVQVDKFVGANRDEIRKRVDGFAESLRSDKMGSSS